MGYLLINSTEKLHINWLLMWSYMPAQNFPGDDHVKKASGLVV